MRFNPLPHQQLCCPARAVGGASAASAGKRRRRAWGSPFYKHQWSACRMRTQEGGVRGQRGSRHAATQHGGATLGSCLLVRWRHATAATSVPALVLETWSRKGGNCSSSQLLQPGSGRADEHCVLGGPCARRTCRRLLAPTPCSGPTVPPFNRRSVPTSREASQVCLADLRC